jgi:hypothetical protein
LAGGRAGFVPARPTAVLSTLEASVTYRRSFALAFVLCAACGSSGGSGELVQTGNEPPEFNDQSPVNGYQEAPADPLGETPNYSDQPDFNSDAPPGDTPVVGGSPETACRDACNAFIQAGCVEDQPGECVADCTDQLVEVPECVDEFAAVLECVTSLPQFFCVNGELNVDGEELFAECPSEYEAYFACLQINQPPEPEPEPSPPPCSIEGGCVCGEVCANCVCTFEDVNFCTVECGL